MPYNCIHCSYSHHFQTNRCSMCNQLQQTTTDIQNFVDGKPTSKHKALEAMNSAPKPPKPAPTAVQRPLPGAPTITEEQRESIERKKKEAGRKREEKQRSLAEQQKLPKQQQRQLMPPPASKKLLPKSPLQKASHFPTTSAAAINPFATAAAAAYAPGPIMLATKSRFDWIYPTSDKYQVSNRDKQSSRHKRTQERACNHRQAMARSSSRKQRAVGQSWPLFTLQRVIAWLAARAAKTARVARL